MTLTRALVSLLLVISQTSAAADDCSLETYQSLLSCQPPQACRPKLMSLHVACIKENEAAYKAVDQAKSNAELSAAAARAAELKDKYGKMPWILFREEGNQQTDSIYLNPITGGSVFFRAAQGYQSGYEQRLAAARQRIKDPSAAALGPPSGHHRAGRGEHNSFLTDASKKLLEAGRWGEAEGLLDFGMEMSPDGMTYALRAMALVKQGKHDAAARDAQKALNLDSTNPLAREILSYVDSTRRGQSIRKLKDDPDFRRFLAGAEDDMASPSGVSGRGSRAPEASQELLHSRGRPALASGSFESLLEGIGNKIKLGDLERALRDADQAVSRKKDDARARILRAKTLNLLRRFEDALRDADEALKIDPGSTTALLERAFALLRLGRHSEALETLGKLLSLDPQNASALLYRARLLELLGRNAQSLADYERAAQLESSYARIYDEARQRLGASRPAKASVGSRGTVIAAAALALAAFIWYKLTRRKKK